MVWICYPTNQIKQTSYQIIITFVERSITNKAK